MIEVKEELVLDENFVKVYYDAEKQLGKIVWSGIATSPQQYKEPFLKLLELTKQGRPVVRFLSDTREQGVVNPQNRKWFEQEMVPNAIEAGLKRSAAISSGNVFKRYYLNMILSAVNKFNMPFKIFSDEESAVEWLMKE